MVAAAAAAQRPGVISAIVSRGGRPDLAGKDTLNKVQVPTLLLVGADDHAPGATHLFEEPGKLEQVARIASGWFRCYFLIKKHSQTES